MSHNALGSMFWSLRVKRANRRTEAKADPKTQGRPSAVGDPVSVLGTEHPVTKGVNSLATWALENSLIARNSVTNQVVGASILDAARTKMVSDRLEGRYANSKAHKARVEDVSGAGRRDVVSQVFPRQRKLPKSMDDQGRSAPGERRMR